jgi:hypothetical protein
LVEGSDGFDGFFESVKTYSHLRKGDLTRRLVAAGYLPGNTPDAEQDLVMEQSPVLPFTRLIDLRGGLTGVIVDLSIRNLSSGYPVHLNLQQFSIDIPWCPIKWLEKAEPLIIPEARRLPAKKPLLSMYFFPGMPMLAFAKDEALNHCLRRECALVPGNELAGPLMGVGERPIPNEFHDRKRFTTCLSAYYERGERCDLQVDFMVEREPKRGQETTFERVKRQRLLEQERNAVQVANDLNHVCNCQLCVRRKVRTPVVGMTQDPEKTSGVTNLCMLRHMTEEQKGREVVTHG